jgi:hypothetical protein
VFAKSTSLVLFVVAQTHLDTSGWRASAPAEARGDVFEDRLDDVGVIVDAELIGHGQKQRIGFRDSFIFRDELLDQNVRLRGVAAGVRICSACWM